MSGDSVAHGIGEGGVFVVPYGGYLRAIEVGTDSPLPVFSSDLLIDTGGRVLTQRFFDGRASLSLNADVVSGAFTGCCFSIPVSAGENVALRFPGTVDVAVGDANGTGFRLSHGSPDPAHQIVFKAFIDPDDQLAPIGPLSLSEGVEAMRLDWNASPGALRYDVYFTTPDDATPQLIRSTRDPWFIDRGLKRGSKRFYSVTAVGATGTVSASANFPPNALPDLLAAESLGDAPAASVELCSASQAGIRQVGQTFTAQAAGTLWSIETQVERRTPEGSPIVDVEILDDEGRSLGRLTRVQTFGAAGPRPLDAVVPATSGGLTVSSLGIPVIAGQKLRFNLTYPGSGCLALRDTVAAYAGGEEWLDGTAHADRDLAFRVLVR